MDQIKSICVYCGSRTGHPEYAKLAKEMGRIMAEEELDLVYGGGSVGLMGIIAKEIKSRGGHVIGIIPEQLHAVELAFDDADTLHVVDDMQSRKRMMLDLSDAFVALPGGLGTLDEILEVVTTAQLRMHCKPTVLVNQKGYWDPFLALVDHMIDGGFVDDEARQTYTTVDSADQVLPALAAWRPPK